MYIFHLLFHSALINGDSASSLQHHSGGTENLFRSGKPGWNNYNIIKEYCVKWHLMFGFNFASFPFKATDISLILGTNLVSMNCLIPCVVTHVWRRTGTSTKKNEKFTPRPLPLVVTMVNGRMCLVSQGLLDIINRSFSVVCSLLQCLFWP